MTNPYLLIFLFAIASFFDTSNIPRGLDSPSEGFYAWKSLWRMLFVLIMIGIAIFTGIVFDWYHGVLVFVAWFVSSASVQYMQNYYFPHMYSQIYSFFISPLIIGAVIYILIST